MSSFSSDNSSNYYYFCSSLVFASLDSNTFAHISTFKTVKFSASDCIYHLLLKMKIIIKNEMFY